MATKKPVKKAAKPVKKTAKPATKPAKAKPVAKKAAQSPSKAPAKKAVAKPVNKLSVKKASKPVAKKAPSKKPVVVEKPAPPKPEPVKRDPGVRAGYVKPTKVSKPERVKTMAPARERVTLKSGYKPSASEEYMNPYHLEYFRQRLLKWKDDLVDESKQTIENLKEEVRDVGDEAERASRESENSLELRTRDRYRKLINKIDSTLKRVEDGTYGYCVDTGDEIGLDRLEARLTAERTIDAQERWEHIQKQMGD